MGELLATTKVAINGNFIVVKYTSMTIGVLSATTKVVANSTTVVVVGLQLATTPCVVVSKTTTKQIVWSLYF
jgi:hypothetical protein